MLLTPTIIVGKLSVPKRTVIRHEADRDWEFEQVRSEIKRLRELLRNPSLSAEEHAIAQPKLDHYLATSQKETLLA